jgi:hypothetical protein
MAFTRQAAVYGERPEFGVRAGLLKEGQAGQPLCRLKASSGERTNP